MFVVAQRRGDGLARLSVFDESAEPTAGPTDAPTDVDAQRLPGVVAELERRSPRWVWSDTRRWYPALLAAGVRVERCVDLRLAHRILRRSTLTHGTPFATGPTGAWDAIPAPAPPARASSDTALFDAALFDTALFDAAPDSARGGGQPADRDEAFEADAVDEWSRQRRVLESIDPASAARLRLLVSAESAGALVAEELRAAGLPWRVDVHDALLTAVLGPRPPEGRRPAELERLLGEIRAWLEDDSVNPDSAPELLKALGRAGLTVRTTRKWELERQSHPVIAPLIDYKQRSRLLQANGWHWIDQWIDADGRFRPQYVVGGVVTGRWATDGGGAMQLPKEIRPAVVADDGWILVVADASQLEPRILAAMSGDLPMMRAGAAGDMYQAMVDAGAVDTRAHAKVGMLGALYGGTTGESGRMLPRLQRAFPTAIAYVEAAARAGERGNSVTTWLGRSSPTSSAGLAEATGDAPPDADPEFDDAADERAGRRAMSDARAWGRFTRNFVVQGTAAEWAECWMASLRRRLTALAPDAVWPTSAPHLVYFLHDEVVVHTPAGLADAVAAEVVAAADEAGRLLFGDRPVRFPLDVAVVRSFADAD